MSTETNLFRNNTSLCDNYKEKKFKSKIAESNEFFETFNQMKNSFQKIPEKKDEYEKNNGFCYSFMELFRHFKCG